MAAGVATAECVRMRIPLLGATETVTGDAVGTVGTAGRVAAVRQRTTEVGCVTLLA